MTTKNDGDAWGCLWGLVILAALGWVIWYILPTSWTDPLLYSMEYSVNMDQVHRNPRPSDCDWGHAPLGDKGCHYKKTVAAYNAGGYLVAGDDAPRYSNDKNTGNPTISYDNGKTWSFLPEDAPRTPDLKVTRVEVGWVKVED